MALRVSAAMAICLLFSLAAIAHSIPVKEAGLTSNVSSAAATAAEVHAVPDGEELLTLQHSDDIVVPNELEEAVEAVAEPDPDRSLPSIDGEEELMDKKLQAAEGQQGVEKTEEKIEDDDEEKEKEKKHGCDGKVKKEKKIKKHRRSDDDDEDEEEERKQIHRHRRVEKKMKKRLQHSKTNNGDDSDDEDEQEKKERRWRKKAISRSMFGHGRRSQREEAAKDGIKN